MKEWVNVKIVSTIDGKRIFRKAKKCLTCAGLYLKGDNRVRNIDFIAGKYKGSPYNYFNLKYKRKSKKTHAIFNNFRGYDSHLIMQEIGKFNVKVDTIPNRLEKFIVLR